MTTFNDRNEEIISRIHSALHSIRSVVESPSLSPQEKLTIQAAFVSQLVAARYDLRCLCEEISRKYTSHNIRINGTPYPFHAVACGYCQPDGHPCSSVILHNSHPVWITYYPSRLSHPLMPNYGPHFRVCYSVVKVPVGRSPRSVDNRALGPRFPRLIDAVDAAMKVVGEWNIRQESTLLVDKDIPSSNGLNLGLFQ